MFHVEHIVNKLDSIPKRTYHEHCCFEAFVQALRKAAGASARGENVVPLAAFHGGAPGGAAPLRHWGARAVATARGGPRYGPQGAFANAPGASRRSISLAREGDGKGGKGEPGARQDKCPGGEALATRLRRAIG